MNGHTNGHTNGSAHCNGSIEDSKGSDFLQRLFELLLRDGVKEGTSAKTKVVEFKHPKELKNCIDLELKDEGEKDSELLDLCEQTIKYSVKTGHPRFFNQLYSGLNHYGLGGAWLTETLNTSQYTYEVAPVFTLMEQVVLQKMGRLAGFEESDGIFCPGGSMSNMYGLNVARYHKFPQVKTEGMQSLPKLCVITSTQSHYSVKKAAALLGIGINNIRLVKCDERGKMVPEALEEEITKAKAEGFHPFFVHATSGTTVVGAYDPLDAIADVCERHNLWMHVDAAWGGGVLLSKRHRHLCKGLERADSLSWNAHKMMGTPLQCCAFLTRHKGLLQEAHSARATYLFQQDKFYDVSYDTGDKSVQCGRKVDVFKLWLMWKAKGNDGFESSMDHIFEMARLFTEKVKTTSGFRIVFPEPECTNVCFWYIPPSLRGHEETEAWWEMVSKIAPMIKQRMMHTGSMLIGYQPHEGKVNFFRLVVINPNVTEEDLSFVLQEIDRLGKDL